MTKRFYNFSFNSLKLKFIVVGKTMVLNDNNVLSHWFTSP